MRGNAEDKESKNIPETVRACTPTSVSSRSFTVQNVGSSLPLGFQGIETGDGDLECTYNPVNVKSSVRKISSLGEAHGTCACDFIQSMNLPAQTALQSFNTTEIQSKPYLDGTDAALCSTKPPTLTEHM